MTHLSAEQIAQWVAGERTPEVERHVAGCARCRAEVDGFEAVLGDFRASARGIVAPVPAFTAPIRATTVREWFLRAAVAAALALLVAAPLYHDRRERAQALREQQDAQLLQQVDAEISRAVPGSMDPLVSMVSWNSDTRNEAQK